MADEDVLQGIVERMADVQAARHIGRRVHDCVWLGMGAIGTECALGFPMRIPFCLNRGGVESLVDSHGKWLCQRVGNWARISRRGGGLSCGCEKLFITQSRKVAKEGRKWAAYLLLYLFFFVSLRLCVIIFLPTALNHPPPKDEKCRRKAARYEQAQPQFLRRGRIKALCDQDHQHRRHRDKTAIRVEPHFDL